MNSESIRELYDRARELKPGPFTTHVGKQYGYMLQVAPPESYYITQIRHPWWKRGLEQEGSSCFRRHGRRHGQSGQTDGCGVLTAILSPRLSVCGGGPLHPLHGRERQEELSSYHRFFTDLDQKAELLKTIAPGAETPRGPTILIYRLRCDAEIGKSLSL